MVAMAAAHMARHTANMPGKMIATKMCRNISLPLFLGSCVCIDFRFLFVSLLVFKSNLQIYCRFVLRSFIAFRNRG